MGAFVGEFVGAAFSNEVSIHLSSKVSAALCRPAGRGFRDGRKRLRALKIVLLPGLFSTALPVPRVPFRRALITDQYGS